MENALAYEPCFTGYINREREKEVYDIDINKYTFFTLLFKEIYIYYTLRMLCDLTLYLMNSDTDDHVIP